jgi:predicted DNA-binding transcriptional regulator AlpA
MQIKKLLVSRKGLRDMGIPLSFTQIDRLEARGKWPKRVKLGDSRLSRVAWFHDDVVAWVKERAAKTKPLTDDFC